MMSSDTNIDYAALGEYTAFSDKARDAARRRHAEMCSLSSYLARQAQSPESETNHNEVLSAVNRMLDAEREMRKAVERANLLAQACYKPPLKLASL
ncbi:hypothetical protein JRC21_27570 [Escherichia coli]|uniref:hypothetical protein n=1 Tax=Escherichia coli TaxID=562 RepID=UPI00193C24F0|nr:hypothetical protein [Escherichia coli]MBM2915440.1 hypothetical protein [Escherichia coli]